MKKKLVKVISKISQMLHSRGVRDIMAIGCIAVALLAFIAIPFRLDTHGLLYAMVACCALSCGIALTYNRADTQDVTEEESTDEL